MHRSLAALLVLLATSPGCGPEEGARDGGEGPEDPLQAWESERPGEAVPATLMFTGALEDSAAALLMERAGVRPFRAYLDVAGLRSVRQVPRSQASSEFLSRLRDEILAELRMVRCAQPGRAVALLEGERGAEDASAARELLANLEELERGTATLSARGPYIHGLSVVGSVQNVREAAADPRVARLEVLPWEGDGEDGGGGEDGGEGWADAPAREIPPEIRDLPYEEVVRRLRGVAEDVEGCGPRGEESDG